MPKRPSTDPDMHEITDEEEAEIQAQIDDENPEWTEENFARARPAKEVLPPELYTQLIKKIERNV